MGVVRAGPGSRLASRLAARAVLNERARAAGREPRRPTIHIDRPRPVDAAEGGVGQVTVRVIRRDDDLRAAKQRVLACAWYQEPNRAVVHSVAGGIGADWDLAAVWEAMDRAVELGWLAVHYGPPGYPGHNLRVVLDEPGRRTPRTVLFAVTEKDPTD